MLVLLVANQTVPCGLEQTRVLRLFGWGWATSPSLPHSIIFSLFPAEMKYLGLVLEYAEEKQTHCVLFVALGVSEKAEWVADIAQVS